MADAVVVDFDGVYDPNLVNDRLLLGLKGTMSEFELNLLRQRSEESYPPKGSPWRTSVPSPGWFLLDVERKHREGP